MGRLTTHVLDTAQGKPAADIEVAVFRIGREERQEMMRTRTNAAGRTATPLLADLLFVAGTYELIFSVGSYFAAQPVEANDPPFLDEVVIRFTVADAAAHYHVPLLVSPWSYTTYRGS